MSPTRWTMLSILALLPVGFVNGCDSDETQTPGTATPTATATATATAGGGGATTGTASGVGGGIGGTGGAGTGGAGTGGGIPPMPTEVAPCQGHVYECGDMVDNDQDGKTDWEDEECTGPCDNTEGSLYGGIPGQAGPACKVDCYFDQDSGSGNDECYWDHRLRSAQRRPKLLPGAGQGDRCATPMATWSS